MKISTCKRAGLAMIALLIFIGAVLVIGGAICYLLIKLCQRVFPATPTQPDQTNMVATIEMVRPEQLTNAMAGYFAPQTVSLVEWGVEVQRTTNLIDWEPLFQTNVNYQINFADDTNAPSDRAFYRLRYFPR